CRCNPFRVITAEAFAPPGCAVATLGCGMQPLRGKNAGHLPAATPAAALRTPIRPRSAPAGPGRARGRPSFIPQLDFAEPRNERTSVKVAAHGCGFDSRPLRRLYLSSAGV